MSGTACRHAVRVEFGDCDPAGIMFFPRYFEMLNACTDRLLSRALDASGPQLAALYGIMGTPLVEARCIFHMPSRWGDELEVESRVTRIGRSSFDITHRICDDAGGLRAEGFEKRVWAVPDAGRTAGFRGGNLPPDVSARLLA